MLCSYFDSDYCADSDDHEHDWRAAAGVARCNNCGLFGSFTADDLRTAYGGFVDGLDRTTASTGTDFANISLDKNIVSAASSGESMVLSSISGNTATFVGAANTDSSEKVYFNFPEFTWPYATGTYTLNFSCIPWDFSYHRKYYGMYVSYNLSIYHKTSDGYERLAYNSSNHEVVDDTTSICNYSINPKLIKGDTYYIYFSLSPDPSYHYTDYCEFVVDSITVNDVYVGLGFMQPSGVDASSRTASLMQTINNYNIDNSYTDNSTNVNFFLIPTGEEPSEDTAVSPAIYDEETLVFTEPATGAQYQTTGWTYDYTTRTYDISLDAGTFSLDGTDVTRIISTYGDELATITYYDASGNALATDEYNYVMMSGSECGLNGHSYTYEEIKAPTCTSSGERKYTCSVCGDQYAEEVPMTAHAYTYSVLKEPTCIDGGINVYTCSTCGNQVTEAVEALGHDWQETGSTTTTITLPEGTSCPECAGSDFALELDEANEIYRLTCNGCGHVWVVPAEVTYGATTYTCSRCGTTKTESDDPESGLFNSIGNLIADGITWAVDKLKELIENLSGITDIFNDYVDSVKENTGQYPALLGAIIAIMPEDFMTVIWFGIVAIIVLAVWKKWFS